MTEDNPKNTLENAGSGNENSPPNPEFYDRVKEKISQLAETNDKRGSKKVSVLQLLTTHFNARFNSVIEKYSSQEGASARQYSEKLNSIREELLYISKILPYVSTENFELLFNGLSGLYLQLRNEKSPEAAEFTQPIRHFFNQIDKTYNTSILKKISDPAKTSEEKSEKRTAQLPIKNNLPGIQAPITSGKKLILPADRTSTPAEAENEKNSGIKILLPVMMVVILAIGIIAGGFLNSQNFESEVETPIHTLVEEEKPIFETLNTSSIESMILEEINGPRTVKFTWNEELAVVAKARSNDMAEKRYFSSENAQGQGYKEMANNLYSYQVVINAENIAKISAFDPSCPSIAQEKDIIECAMKKFTSDPESNQNISSTIWRKTGIGVSFDGEYTYYIVQEFR